MSGGLVDLIWLGPDLPQPPWSLGAVVSSEPAAGPLRERLTVHLEATTSPFCLFWDGSLGRPEEERIREIVEKPGDLWHAGLLLGMLGLPRLIDFVTPTWMLNRDPDPMLEATSWRMSLRACVMRTSVLRTMGGPSPDFRSLDSASCEMGHRYASRGVIPRHVPSLLRNVPATEVLLPFDDELRFVRMRFGSFWAHWALLRAVMTGFVSVSVAWTHSRLARAPTGVVDRAVYPPCAVDVSKHEAEDGGVTVLIPTLDRYPYLRQLLAQVREQTVRPLEIILVDQTPSVRRDPSLAADFSDLPLVLIHRDHPGQCSSRNAGLAVARGKYILFLDDDDEVPPQLIEAHLQNLERNRASASSGVSSEVGAGALPEAFTFFRVSDVFPAGNTLALRSAFADSGLFDLAYERGARADGDLGMRVYLSGALMVLDPSISVLHHHAPTGGLRAHQARVTTYASSRKHLLHRHLPSPTEIYLAMRYFRPDQVKEMLWQRVLATVRIQGSLTLRSTRVALSLLLLPDTLWRLRRAYREAVSLTRTFPRIPALTEDGRAGES